MIKVLPASLALCLSVVPASAMPSRSSDEASSAARDVVGQDPRTSVRREERGRDAGWVPVHNDRYGFSVEVPAGFTPLPPSENGDGSAFTSKDGRSTIGVYGHLFVDVDGLVDDERDQERMSAGDGLRVTYRQVSRLATTFSGLSRDTIVYQHAIGTCNGTASAILHVEYPASEKSRFDPVIAHMTRTLRGSNRCWSPG